MTTAVSADIRVFCKAPGRKLTGLFHKINAYQTVTPAGWTQGMSARGSFWILTH